MKSNEHGVPGCEDSHVLMEQPDTPLPAFLPSAAAAGLGLGGLRGGELG